MLHKYGNWNAVHVRTNAKSKIHRNKFFHSGLSTDYCCPFWSESNNKRVRAISRVTRRTQTGPHDAKLKRVTENELMRG